MLCVPTHAFMSYAHRAARTQASQPPLLYVARQELLMDMPFMQAK